MLLQLELDATEDLMKHEDIPKVSIGSELRKRKDKKDKNYTKYSMFYFIEFSPPRSRFAHPLRRGTMIYLTLLKKNGTRDPDASPFFAEFESIENFKKLGKSRITVKDDKDLGMRYALDSGDKKRGPKYYLEFAGNKFTLQQQSFCLSDISRVQFQYLLFFAVEKMCRDIFSD